MARLRLTEEMVIARSKQSDLTAIKKLNIWGAELGDVSLLRRMPNVEMLAFSINKIRGLADFAHCPRLRELYIRKNEIRDLAEIRHLRGLTRLTNLWLAENPCADRPDYRHTVLRNLPGLERLDDVPVHPEEIEEASRRGVPIPDSDDEGYAQEPSRRRPSSVGSSTEREPSPYGGGGGGGGEEAEGGREEEEAATRSPTTPTPPASLRHSRSAQSVKEYAAISGECRPSYHDPYQDRQEGYQRSPAEGGDTSAREYSSAVMAEHRGFIRRPVTRNSNLLSAVLCLVKELDYPSLEVAEMAVRCRMDELANAQ